jgi:hypothetical protein
MGKRLLQAAIIPPCSFPTTTTVLIAGGTATGTRGPEVLAKSEVYIPWRYEFRAIGNMETAKAGAMALALAEIGKVTIAGGRNGSAVLANAETITVPAIFTDRPNYHPREAVQLSGTGWQPGEAMQLSIGEAASSAEPAMLSPIADDSGRWSVMWAAPGMGDRDIPTYATGTQQYAAMDGGTGVLTARAVATGTSVAIVTSSNCKGIGIGNFGFGAPVCAVVSGLIGKAGDFEQLAWISPTGTIYVDKAAVWAGRAPDSQTPNGGGQWTLKAFRDGGYVLAGGLWTCSGTPHATRTVSIGSGKPAFTSPAITMQAGSCSPAIGVQIQTDSTALPRRPFRRL